MSKKRKGRRTGTLVLVGGIAVATTVISVLVFLIVSLNGTQAAWQQQASLPSGDIGVIASQPSLEDPPPSSANSAVQDESAEVSSVESLPDETDKGEVLTAATASDSLLAAGQILAVPSENSGVAIYSGRTGLGKVALTFDSGWLFEPTETLLQALADNEVEATFFLRGGWIDANPDLVRKIKEGGHEIGNHTYTHGHMPELSGEELREELESTGEALRAVIGADGQGYYRPPYGEYGDRDVAIAGESGYRFTVLWSIDSIDWMEPGEEEILDRVGYQLQDGGIALMHVGVWQTANILPEVIATLRSRGLEPVPLSEILDWDALPAGEHVVEAGETLQSIADAYRTTCDLLKKMNTFD